MRSANMRSESTVPSKLAGSSKSFGSVDFVASLIVLPESQSSSLTMTSSLPGTARLSPFESLPSNCPARAVSTCELRSILSRRPVHPASSDRHAARMTKGRRRTLINLLLWERRA